MWHEMIYPASAVEAMIREAVAAEREACAKVADEYAQRKYGPNDGPVGVSFDIAEAIRARSKGE